MKLTQPMFSHSFKNLCIATLVVAAFLSYLAGECHQFDLDSENMRKEHALITAKNREIADLRQSLALPEESPAPLSEPASLEF